MLITNTVISLEMTTMDQLVPAGPPPAPVDLESVTTAALPLIRETHDRLAAAHDWRSLKWSDAEWIELLSRPGNRTWIAWVKPEVLGLVLLESQPGGDVEIVQFGVVPDFIGRGFGGHLLATAVRLAWDCDPVDDTPVERVWLRTSTLDHPNALQNYLARGFREFERKTYEREFPLPD